jgi:hypothetical protein
VKATLFIVGQRKEKQMSKHTPGPWEARGKAIVVRGSPRWNNAYNGRICNVQGAGEGDNKINETAKANARLIAAAPAMYEALQKILAVKRTVDLNLFNIEEIHSIAEAALRAAERGE